MFTEPPDKDNWEADAPIVLLLCQWAVGPQRTGEHRALAIARLLEHRQTDIFNAGESSATNGDNSVKQNDPGSAENGKNPSEDDDGLITMNGTDGGPDSAGNANANNQGSGGCSSVSSNSNNGGNVNSSYPEMNGEESNPGMEDENNEFSGFPIYHNLLFKFLDSEGPILGIGK